jgi:ApaG protein
MTIESYIDVNVTVEYLGVEERGRHFQHAFAYKIRITNFSTHTVKLLDRHWWIVDANNNLTEVSGEGVVGQTPTLVANQDFEYTSWALIDTNFGTMRGEFGFLDLESNTRFVVVIDEFALARPGVLQ